MNRIMRSIIIMLAFTFAATGCAAMGENLADSMGLASQKEVQHLRGGHTGLGMRVDEMAPKIDGALQRMESLEARFALTEIGSKDAQSKAEAATAVVDKIGVLDARIADVERSAAHAVRTAGEAETAADTAMQRANEALDKVSVPVTKQSATGRETPVTPPAPSLPPPAARAPEPDLVKFSQRIKFLEAMVRALAAAGRDLKAEAEVRALMRSQGADMVCSLNRFPESSDDVEAALRLADQKVRQCIARAADRIKKGEAVAVMVGGGQDAVPCKEARCANLAERRALALAGKIGVPAGVPIEVFD